MKVKINGAEKEEEGKTEVISIRIVIVIYHNINNIVQAHLF